MYSYSYKLQLQVYSVYFGRCPCCNLGGSHKARQSNVSLFSLNRSLHPLLFTYYYPKQMSSLILHDSSLISSLVYTPVACAERKQSSPCWTDIPAVSAMQSLVGRNQPTFKSTIPGAVVAPDSVSMRNRFGLHQQFALLLLSITLRLFHRAPPPLPALHLADRQPTYPVSSATNLHFLFFILFPATAVFLLLARRVLGVFKMLMIPLSLGYSELVSSTPPSIHVTPLHWLRDHNSPVSPQIRMNLYFIQAQPRSHRYSAVV